MVGAAGAIYVLGGYSDGTFTTYNDVWASTDGGARPDSFGGVVGGTLCGYSGGTSGHQGGTLGY